MSAAAEAVQDSPSDNRMNRHCRVDRQSASAVRGGDDDLVFEQDLLYPLNGELVYVGIGIALRFAWQLVCLHEDVGLFNQLVGHVHHIPDVNSGTRFPEGMG